MSRKIKQTTSKQKDFLDDSQNCEQEFPDIQDVSKSFNISHMQQETVRIPMTNTLVVPQAKRTYAMPKRSKKYLRNKKPNVVHTVKQSNKHNQAKYLSRDIKAMINQSLRDIKTMQNQGLNFRKTRAFSSNQNHFHHYLAFFSKGSKLSNSKKKIRLFLNEPSEPNTTFLQKFSEYINKQRQQKNLPPIPLITTKQHLTLIKQFRTWLLERKETLIRFVRTGSQNNQNVSAKYVEEFISDLEKGSVRKQCSRE